MTQVFISYSRKDLSFVERLAEDLKAASLEVWYDLSGLDGGTRWGREIQNAIERCQCFVVVLSPNSVESQWVEREFMYAESLKRKIIPLLYQPCNTPMWFINLHFIDVQGTNYDSHFWVILKALGVTPGDEVAKSAVNRGTGTEEKVSEHRFLPPPRKIKVRPVWIIALAGFAMVLAFAVWGMPQLAARLASTLTPTTTATYISASMPTATVTHSPTSTPLATATMGSSQVEIFYPVNPGSEDDGLSALIKLFNQQYSTIKFINAAAGGAGTNADALLASRLASNDIPDSWRVNLAQETITAYVTSDLVKPLDDLFASTGFGVVLPKTLLPFILRNGHPYIVPMDILRMNVMWYNPKVLAAAGITANPKTDFKTWEDFFAVCDKIKAAGKICLSLGAPWTTVNLFENVMIGTIGAGKWSGLWTAPPSTDWAGADVAAGIANFAKALSYTNADASTLSDYQTASKMVSDGDAAFNIMADWAYAYFANSAPNGLALKPHTDFDWAVAPGTYGIFEFLSNGYPLPVGAKHPDATTAWLTVVASKPGQEAINPLEGSICARTDCNQALFNEYSQDAAKDWTSNVLVGSLLVNIVGNHAWETSILTDINSFQANTSRVADFQAALVAACKKDGTCK